MRQARSSCLKDSQKPACQRPLYEQLSHFKANRQNDYEHLPNTFFWPGAHFPRLKIDIHGDDKTIHSCLRRHAQAQRSLLPKQVSN